MDNNENRKLFWCCVLGGTFGLHKFIKGDILMGFVYLFTNGLWGIGWIIDCIRIYTDTYDIPINKCFEKIKKEYKEEKDIEVSEFKLSIDEKCLFKEEAFIYRERSIDNAININGYNLELESDNPISYSNSKKIKNKHNQNKERCAGTLYLTNQRIVFVQNNILLIDENLENITTIKNKISYIQIYLGEKEYKIYTNKTSIFFLKYTLQKNYMNK